MRPHLAILCPWTSPFLPLGSVCCPPLFYLPPKLPSSCLLSSAGSHQQTKCPGPWPGVPLNTRANPAPIPQRSQNGFSSSAPLLWISLARQQPLPASLRLTFTGSACVCGRPPLMFAVTSGGVSWVLLYFVFSHPKGGTFPTPQHQPCQPFTLGLAPAASQLSRTSPRSTLEAYYLLRPPSQDPIAVHCWVGQT